MMKKLFLTLFICLSAGLVLGACTQGGSSIDLPAPPSGGDETGNGGNESGNGRGC